MRRMLHTSFVIALLCGVMVALAAPAHAQFGAAQRGFQPPVRPKDNTRPAEPAPPALPGATSTSAPADKTALDLPPTEALFDAINRGDIGSARDAVSRGADLGGHNVLGMTPLDLSVDLSRNDITFLLLSMRGATPSAPAPSGAATAAAAPAPRKAARRPAAALAIRATPPPVAPPTVPPRQYAGPGDAGTPAPQAGFLGFGGTVR